MPATRQPGPWRAIGESMLLQAAAGVVSAVAVWGTLRGYGPFASNVWLAGAYGAVLLVTAIAFARAVAREKVAAEKKPAGF